MAKKFPSGFDTKNAPADGDFFLLSDSEDALRSKALKASSVVRRAGDTLTGELNVDASSSGSVPLRESLLRIMPTGVISGCAVTLDGTSNIVISSGFAERVDNSTSPSTYKVISCPGQTVANPYLSSAFTYVYLNDDGTAYLTNAEPSMASYTARPFLGVVANVGGAQVAPAGRALIVSDFGAQLQEFLRLIGPMNVRKLIRVSANGANRSLNFSAGSIWRLGANADVNPSSPNIKAVTAKTAPQLYFYYTNAGGAIVSAGNSNLMNVTQYNSAGTLTSIPTNKYVNARVTMSPNGNVLVLLPDTYYNSLAEAISGRGSEATLIPQLIGEQIFVGWVTYKESQADLSNTTYANITNA